MPDEQQVGDGAGVASVDVVRLRGVGFDAVVAVGDGGPTIVHWGAPLGGVDENGVDSLRALLVATQAQGGHGSLDVVAPLAVVPMHAAGFSGRPGLLGHRRRGVHWAPRFASVAHEVVSHEVTVAADGAEQLVVRCRDDVADLDLVVTFEARHCLVVWAEVTNTHASERYLVDALTITLPVPDDAAELGAFTGRWTRELHLERRAWVNGAHVAENRRGRTSHETPPLVFAGTPGWGEWHGEVRGAHLAWSGNHTWLADRLADGRRLLQLGELLHPGEVSLAPGESYRTPEVIAVWSDAGLTSATQRFHHHLRARPTHPTSPRPVLVNTWEAVYFDHDQATLRRLAERAATVGVERFVLDDGWFGSRRDDRRGLGDWVVSPEVYPDGLTPLIEYVTGLGMEFGIWVEPEMVNPDSDLFRAHPEWVLATDGYEPVLGRNQLVLDLGRDDAFAHVLAQLDALLAEHDISYVKWDMNRDHVAASGERGAAGTHAQTLAVYRLLDELCERHPDVEFESCASGGGRIDHEILRRTVRVWTSDCNDALERQTIQRGASMLVPPELMGAHIGPPRAHTTRRRQSLAFRAVTAMFGHLGVEWNLLDLDERELDALAQVIALHKRFRPLLHRGDVVRFDVDESIAAHGVYAPDRTEAVVSIARLVTAPSLTPPRLRLPGLDPDRRYHVAHVPVPTEPPIGGLGPNRAAPGWWDAGVDLTGAQLALIGLQLPALHPETAILLHLTST